MSGLVKIGHALKWTIYIIRVILSAIYDLFQIASKPGMRRLFPFILAGLFLVLRSPIHDLVGVPADFSSGMSWALDTCLLLAIWPLSWMFSLLSRATALVIGVFPPITKPLKPLGRLRSPSNLSTKSTTVKSAVPPLRRRQ